MKVLFVRRAFLINNAEFRGSAIIESLKAANHEIRIVSAIVPDSQWNQYSTELKEEILSATDLPYFDAVYVEGGYRTLQSSSSTEILGYVNSGGILVLADNDSNGISGEDDLILTYERMFGGRPDGNSWNPIKIDESFSLDDVYNTRFSTQNMDVVGLEKELIQDLGEIAVGSPVSLHAHTATYLLTGTNLSSYLQSDLFVEPNITRAWAILNHFGLGYAILIGGRFTDRITFNAVPGNSIWLERVLNRLKLLVDLEKPTKRQGSKIQATRPWEMEESKHHEKKSSAFKPLTTGDEKTVVHSMSKSIAAFCNTEGGTLVIGQADDGTILGLKEDMDFKRKVSLDKYELAIRDVLRAKFGKTLEVIGVQLDFHEVEEKPIAVFTCPASSAPVYTRGDKDNNEHLYIRDGNRTNELLGSELVEYMSHFKP
jgi:hypothetical protein